MFVVIVSTPCYLHFISYAVTLASFRPIGLDWRRLSSYIVPEVWSGVSLDVGSVGCVVDNVDSDIGQSVRWRFGWSISYSVGSGVDRLRYFVFASSLFSHRVEGALTATSLVRML
jgi:hypothetical protein